MAGVDGKPAARTLDERLDEFRVRYDSLYASYQHLVRQPDPGYQVWSLVDLAMGLALDEWEALNACRSEVSA